MARSLWTLLLIPRTNTAVRRLQITQRGLVVAAGFLFALGGVLALLGRSYVAEEVDRARLRGLEEENQVLGAKLQQLRDLASHLSSKVEDLSRLERTYRTIAGLSGIEPEVREAGIGGPGGDLRGEERRLLRGKLGLASLAEEATLRTLLRRATVVYESLAEACDQLQYYQERLAHTPSIWPTVGRVTSTFGSRLHPIFDRPKPHEGIDISTGKGTPVVAPAAGTVTVARWRPGYGQTIEIDHRYGFSTFYAHLSRLTVRAGQVVRRGEVIGYVGDTGVSTGPHLHYEVKVNQISTNPAKFILSDVVPD